MPQPSNAAAPIPGRARPRDWIWGGALVALDVVVTGLPGIGLFVAMLRALVSGIKAVASRLRRTPGYRADAARCAIFAAAALLVLVGFWGQLRVGSANAARVIDALERYRAAEGRYPPTLAAMTPAYLARVPRCAYRILLPCRFHYHAEGQTGMHTLWWIAYPPFGRPVYQVETRTWSYLD
ncbi:MAG: hypothetical protein M0015_18200 [Betaproteobacteria bacterium]|nr:hypothetical protein [Betaproteobacteria bacterium]